jgi:hypothetical protein
LPVYLEELYRIVENLCTFNEAAFLYEKLKELIVNNTKYKAEKLYKESHSLSKYEFLRHMCFYWDQHCKEMVSIFNFVIIKFLFKKFVPTKSRIFFRKKMVLI